MTALCLVAQATLTLLGFALLCGAMDRHERAIHGRELTETGRRRRRLGAAACLLLSLLWLAQVHGSGTGFVLWCLLMGACALVVVALATYRPAWLAGRLGVPR